jgi:hypothetical protein
VVPAMVVVSVLLGARRSNRRAEHDKRAEHQPCRKLRRHTAI